MSTVTDFINKVKLKEGFKFDGQVAELLGIDRRILANWKARESLPTKYHQWYCDRYDIELKDFKQEIKLTNKDIELEGARDMEAKYVIELQKDKIEHQSTEIKHLKYALEKKQAESSHWDNLMFDFKVEIKIKRSGFKFTRVITDVDDLTTLSERTGYTKDELKEFWAIKREYGINDKNNSHPINHIISDDSEQEVGRLVSSLPYIFDSLKNMIGEHYIPVPLVYKHKDGVTKVNTITYNKINWFKMTISTKIQFLEV